MARKKLFFNSLRQVFVKRRALVLFFIVLFSSMALIVINFYTIRVTSAVRAYIHGESEFSKSQKDAFLYLSNYILLEDPHLYKLFKQEIAVPQGDNFARVSLITKKGLDDVKKGFLIGRNNPRDLDNMIWLYKNFKSVTFMETAVGVWENAEPLINEVDTIANNAYREINNHTLTQDEKQAYINRISVMSGKLSNLERTFSRVLSDTARTSDTYLFSINVFVIILILGSLVSLAIITINRLSRYANDLKQNNFELNIINKELDTFVYSASHDLRSPIASLKGLIDLSLEEDEPATRQTYLHLMGGIIEKLDFFLRDILDFFKNKRQLVNNAKISLQKLVDDAVGLVQFIPLASHLQIIKEIDVDNMYSDELRIKIILNNLISNAIKYTDLNKEKRYVKISTKKQGDMCIIAVEDNGIGIHKDHHERIFDMDFSVQKNRKSTGLGLYIVKEIVDKLQGQITVASNINEGSTFTVSLPYLP